MSAKMIDGKAIAAEIKEGLKEAGYTVFGGTNAPYIWLKVPSGMKSWEFFDYLLKNLKIVGTPGSGFGKNGENYFRLSCFVTCSFRLKSFWSVMVLPSLLMRL